MVDLSRLKLLIIDDSPNIVRILTAVLNGAGIDHIATAQSADEALVLVKEQAFDLIITDYMMAGQNGLELTQHIRKGHDAPNPSVPILMLSGFCDEVFAKRAVEQGVTRLCAKPFSPQDLIQEIIDVVDADDKGVADNNTAAAQHVTYEHIHGRGF